MALPTRAQQIGWVVLLTALAVLVAARTGCRAAGPAAGAARGVQAEGGKVAAAGVR